MKNEECKHENTSPFTAKREIKGHIFTYETTKCDDCGSVAFTSDHSKQFYLWIKELKKENREIFRVQKFKLPDYLWNFVINDFSRYYAEETGDDLNFNLLIIASVNVYLNKISKNTKLSNYIEDEFEKCEAKFVTKPDQSNFKVEPTPKQYIEFMNWAKKLDMTERELMESLAARTLFAVKKELEGIGQELIEKMAA